MGGRGGLIVIFNELQEDESVEIGGRRASVISLVERSYSNAVRRCRRRLTRGEDYSIINQLNGSQLQLKNEIINTSLTDPEKQDSRRRDLQRGILLIQNLKSILLMKPKKNLFSSIMQKGKQLFAKKHQTPQPTSQHETRSKSFLDTITHDFLQAAKGETEGSTKTISQSIFELNEIFKINTSSETLPDGIYKYFPKYSENRTNLLDSEESKEDSHSLIEMLVVVGFHHKKGSIVEYALPQENWQCYQEMEAGNNELKESALSPLKQKLIYNLFSTLTFRALPDAAHNVPSDFCFFIFPFENQLYYCVSCYRQIQTSLLVKKAAQVSRSFVQKAVCIVTKVPSFGSLLVKVEPTTRAYFDQKDFSNNELLHLLFNNTNLSSKENSIYYSEFMSGLFLRKLVLFLKERVRQSHFSYYPYLSSQCLKAESLSSLQEARVSPLSSSLLWLFSLEPVLTSSFQINKSKPLTQELLKSQKAQLRYGFPLKVFHSQSLLAPMFTLQDLDMFVDNQSYLIGTTNQLIPTFPKAKPDVVINLDTGKFDIQNLKLVGVMKLSKTEKKFMQTLVNEASVKGEPAQTKWLVESLDSDMTGFEGSEDSIRNYFKTYFHSFACQIALARKLLIERNQHFLKELKENQEVPHQNLIELDEHSHQSKSQKRKYKSPSPPPKRNQIAPEPVMKINKSEGVSLLDLEGDSNSAPVMAPDVEEAKSPEEGEQKIGWDLLEHSTATETKEPEEAFECLEDYFNEGIELTKSGKKKKKGKGEQGAMNQEREPHRKQQGVKSQKQFQVHIEELLKDYSFKFIKSWTQTINYKVWLSEHSQEIANESFKSGETYNNKVLYDNGDTYFGDLLNGEREGSGTFTEKKTGIIYTGEWVHGKREGNGTLTSKDNQYIYDGQWKDNSMSGQGQLITAQLKYSGGFKKGEFHGHGVLCENCGTIYEGDFEGGKKQGMARFKSEQGDNYVGSFFNDKYGGEGQLTYANGDIYSGWFDGGERSGTGSLINTHKAYEYSGQWWKNQPHGRGTVTKEDGFMMKAIFAKGELVKEEELEVKTATGLKLTGKFETLPDDIQEKLVTKLI